MMAINPLRQAIRNAVQVNRDLGKMFDKVGNQRHPRGEVLSAYRLAIRAVRSNPQPGNIRLVMGNLRSHVQRTTSAMLVQAARIGYQSAKTQLGFYGARAPSSPRAQERIEELTDSILDTLQAQASGAEGLAMLEREPELIAGDDERQGVVRPGPVITGIDLALATILAWVFSTTVRGSSGVDFQKVAVAVLDARTTNCCCEVHGQIQPFSGTFQLTGTPRFADQMDWSPFHFYCRTSVALCAAGFDDGLSAQMVADAAWLLAERAAGRKPDQSPADAFWNS